MKVVILAGGRPSTITDEQEGIPKPMVEIGGKPLIWHIMKSFSAYGFHEFIVCGGYKVEMIKEYFMNYAVYESDITIDLQKNEVKIHQMPKEDWRVTVLDTGLDATTAQRVAMVREYIQADNFVVTYGDCLSNIDLGKMIEYHMEKDKMATMAVSGTTGRNEALRIDEKGRLLGKANGVAGAWTNACTYVLKKEIFAVLSKQTHLEQQLMDKLVPLEEMITYRHYGFWMPVETYRDRVRLEGMWNDREIPWLEMIDREGRE